MNTTVTRQKHLNADAFVVENEELRVAVLPAIGAKIASIVYVESGFEFLFQPTRNGYDEAEPFDAFSAYDTSGIDEAIPTIDACRHPVTGADLPDHGEVWARRWHVEEEDGTLFAAVDLQTLPLRFTRRLHLDGATIRLSYRVQNLSDEPVAYLWAFHGLNQFDDDTSICLPKGDMALRIFGFD